MDLNVDLNALPAESWQAEGSAAAPIDLQHEYMPIQSSPGSFDSPIDADAIEDDVVLLPSSAWCPRVKNQPRRKRTVVIVENLEINTGWSGTAVDEPVTVLSLSSQKLHNANSFGRVTAGCELNANETYISKIGWDSISPHSTVLKLNDVMMHNTSGPHKETTLTCPVCMCTLNEPSSTVCGHVFCHSCIEIVIGKQKKCPTCRRKLTKRNYHRIYLP